ncbi:Cellobiose phosphorylase [Pedococcus dokdonensis]|uniref:Cellobiose phosphorylase n=2 Tax=Pedococcus dokdonensis TaxID=443156 RepID=A0A1H0SJU7_9MICO|nr:Cellobiose phosphorylase [Pedococcus dokdonensis]
MTRGHHELSSASGLRAVFTDHGSLARLDAGPTSLLMYPASAHESGPANLYLRLLDGAGTTDGASRDVAWVPLLGPSSRSVVTWSEAGPVARGEWQGLRYAVWFRLADAAPAWFWHVEVENTGGAEVEVDVVLAHDPGLAPYDGLRVNEFYVSQYLDLTPVATENGTALAVRQNMPGQSVPWMLLGSLVEGRGWATDTLQLVRGAARPGAPVALSAADLPSHRLQHEHALAVLQDTPVRLASGGRHVTGFYGIVSPDHPEATSDADAAWHERALSQAEARPPTQPGTDDTTHSLAAPRSIFSTAPPLAVDDLDADTLAELTGDPDPRHLETDAEGRLLSWFGSEGSHVVTAAKERLVLRPHGHVLRTGDALVPDTGTLTSTLWMTGGFHSQLTRGHVGRGRLLSTRRGYLGVQRAHGLRVFVEEPSAEGGWALLETPSAWALRTDRATWWYARDDLALEVSSTAPSDAHELGWSVRWLSGAPRRLLVALNIAVDGDDGLGPAAHDVAVRDDGADIGAGSTSLHLGWPAGAVSVAADGPLFTDGEERGTSWVTLEVAPRSRFALTLSVTSADGDQEVRPTPEQRLGADWTRTVGALRLTAGASDPALAAEVAAIDTALPWFTQNALVHYLSPRGLEQFSGGAWGTRDVCQGPVGLLTALGRDADQRDVLLRLFRAQNARGDWPQAFDFLPPLAEAGQQDAHGDVLYWPVLAVGDYLRSTGDASLLSEGLPFVGDDALTPPASVEDHLRRALDRVAEVRVPGTSLPAYGHGDWNDSLQPADPHLAARLVSTWTTVLLVTALRSLADGLESCDAAPDLVTRAREAADAAHTALTDDLVVDGVLPGYVLLDDDGGSEPLVHPRDTRTGLTHGVLPWIHAISADLLSAEQARHHLDLIDQHLLGPDGARLFDRPVAYSGGPMKVFQRAEASTFWGREIGLMYMHAHLRYAEALARVGDAEQLFAALCQANPIGVTERVPRARPRQSTTYYSSSDGAFDDRLDASERYAALMAGDVDLEGGWRVYSSGPGLYLRLLAESLLGVRSRGALIEIDPVLAPGLDGLNARIPLGDKGLRVTYRVGSAGSGVVRVVARGRELETTPLANPYRSAGVSVRRADLLAAAVGGEVELTVETL